MRQILITAATFASLAAGTPALAREKGSSAHQEQMRGEAAIPRCTRKLGTVAIVEPDNQWWRELSLGSPESILRIFIQLSGCFTMVNRGPALGSRNLERAMADAGELQANSNLGAGQVKAADYFLQPAIFTANQNSGGGGLGGMFGRAGAIAGSVAGGINVKKGEARTTLSLVNALTTEEQAMTQGYARKKDTSFNMGASFSGGGGWGGADAGGYQNTATGQIIVLS